MLEKDIENLIATYPEEFLPYVELKLVGQQVRLGTNFPVTQDEWSFISRLIKDRFDIKVL
jgi:hypothetical protein|tara:strand:- start:1556 stop:1735 length:180 start_codon:yes stop_codon:yes gene_type:complete